MTRTRLCPVRLLVLALFVLSGPTARAGEDCINWTPAPDITATISTSADPKPVCLGSQVTVTVTASDQDTCYGKQTGLPYRHLDTPLHYEWTALPAGCPDPGDSPGLNWIASSAGTYTFTVKVYDEPNNPPDRVNRHEYKSFSRTVRVNAPPTIAIAKPAGEGEYVGWSDKNEDTLSTKVKVYVEDSDGVSRVEAWVDGVFKDLMVQVNDYWQYEWDTHYTSPGEHTITIYAFDGYSCRSTSNRKVIAKPGLELCEITFQNDHTLWLRNSDTEITWPHYSTVNFITWPIAYTAGSPVTTKVQITGDINESVYLRYEASQVWSNRRCVPKKTYTDIDASTTGRVMLPYDLTYTVTAPDAVTDYILDQSYDYYIRKYPDSDWCPAGRESLFFDKVFLTFGSPIGPWGTLSVPRACWVEVIDSASQWMPDDGFPNDEPGQLLARKRLTYHAYMNGGKIYEGGGSHCDPTGTAFALWEFLNGNTKLWADCRDMSSYWVKLCNSLGMDGQVRRVVGPLQTKPIYPVGAPHYPILWESVSWNFHQFGSYINVFDPCIQLDQSNPRVPQNEDVNNPYKLDLWDQLALIPPNRWDLQMPFSLEEIDEEVVSYE